jgi:hypothetical protein
VHQQNTAKERFPRRTGDLFPFNSPAVKKVYFLTIATLKNEILHAVLFLYWKRRETGCNSPNYSFAG